MYTWQVPMTSKKGAPPGTLYLITAKLSSQLFVEVWLYQPFSRSMISKAAKMRASGKNGLRVARKSRLDKAALLGLRECMTASSEACGSCGSMMHDGQATHILLFSINLHVHIHIQTASRGFALQVLARTAIDRPMKHLPFSSSSTEFLQTFLYIYIYATHAHLYAVMFPKKKIKPETRKRRELHDCSGSVTRSFPFFRVSDFTAICDDSAVC